MTQIKHKKPIELNQSNSWQRSANIFKECCICH